MTIGRNKVFRIIISHCGLRIAWVLLLIITANAGAMDKSRSFITFTFENDIFVGDDDGYTNGMGVTFGHGPFEAFDNHNLPGWINWLIEDTYIATMPQKKRGVAHMFFQRMQTPENLSEKELIGDDVPYAGLLAWQGTLYAWDDQVADRLSLYLGAVGPVTLAEQTQSIIHDLGDADEPQGWDNQIGNEPIFKVEIQRVWRLYHPEGKGNQFDILGLWGAGIGNLESATKAGFAVRWGMNLPHNFQAFAIQTDRQINPLSLAPDENFYLFFAGRAGVVFNNILIDGNSFKESHSVPLEHSQNQVSAGVVWGSLHSAFVFQVSSTSSDTKIIDNRDAFGALSMTYRF